MKKYIALLMALFITLLFTSCLSRTEPKILLDDEYLQITQTGAKIDVYDVLGGVTYTFHIRHKNASKRLTEPYTAVDTPTLRIEQRRKEIILTVKKRKNKYTLRIGKIFPIISVKKGVYNENFR